MFGPSIIQNWNKYNNHRKNTKYSTTHRILKAT